MHLGRPVDAHGAVQVSANVLSCKLLLACLVDTMQTGRIPCWLILYLRLQRLTMVPALYLGGSIELQWQ